MLAFAGGSFIFLAVIIAFFLAVVYGFFTRKGSGINQRPSDGRGEAPGAEGSSRISSAEREY
jgi:hypothetical protein